VFLLEECANEKQQEKNSKPCVVHLSKHILHGFNSGFFTVVDKTTAASKVLGFLECQNNLDPCNKRLQKVHAIGLVVDLQLNNLNRLRSQIEKK